VRVVAAITLAWLAAGCPAESETPLPCDVDQVLADKCRQCHGSPVEFGAPIELIAWEDTQATIDSEQVWKIMERRVHATVEPMPPRGLPTLTAEELAILDAWFDGGAPPRAADLSCE
jgi:uncharacterized membrane protein